MRFAEVSASVPPLLLVIVDTEEEFDWGAPVSRSNTAVSSIAEQHLAQDVFAAYGVVPTYVVDYPVATDEASVHVLGAFLAEGRCEIGAHLHPWVNPPHEETVNVVNSYPGNLSPDLERSKLERLTQAIEENFGIRPTVYKAGRYGLGPATAKHLEQLGYEVDLSVVPYTSFDADGGPDFRAFDFRPYWFGDRRRLLAVPLSCGFAGVLARRGPAIFPTLAGPFCMRWHVPGIAARLGLLERIRLTPEGIDHAAHRRLTGSSLKQGCRIFTLTYHSPSLQPGCTPYVRSRDERTRFLETIDRYLGFFFNELGGQSMTPAALYRLLRGQAAASQP